MVKEKSKRVITLESLDEKLDRLVGGLDAKFDEKFERVFRNLEQLHYKIDEVDGRLGAKIDAVESKLGARIDDLDNRLSARIDDLDLKIMQSFTLSKERIESVDGKLDSIYAELTDKIAAVA